jgi:N6-adenosine-specific RNA methylase IME4
MTDEEVMQLPVESFAADTCALFLWSSGTKLQSAIDTMRRWGFDYKGVFFVWAKASPDTIEASTRCEFCLLGVRGAVSTMRKSRKIHQLLVVPETDNRRKPEEARHRIEQFFHGDNAKSAKAKVRVRKLEMFRTVTAPGWRSWSPAADASTPEVRRDARRIRLDMEIVPDGNSIFSAKDDGPEGTNPSNDDSRTQ